MTNETQQAPDKFGKRKQIVEAAFKLFKVNGFYATGVDLIMRQANVSKRTMYIYFPTKNELIVAVLEHYRNEYERNIAQLLARTDIDSRGKILAIFDGASRWFSDSEFHGCLAVNAMGEFAGKDSAIEQACQLFKAYELGVFRALTKDIPAQKPEELAYKLLVLLEGMCAIAQVLRQPCPVDIRQMINTLIDGECVGLK
jgi:AcrR family transcriptional regulator